MVNWTIASILPKTPDIRISKNDPEKATRAAVAELTAATRMSTQTGYGIVFSSAHTSHVVDMTDLSLNTPKNSTSLTGRDLVPDDLSIDLMEE
jgi:hypothetical protein